MLQVNEQNFLKIVDDAFNNLNQTVRETNQRAIEEFMVKQSDNFVELCAREFQNISVNTHLRVVVSTVLKGGIAPNEDSGKATIWTHLSPNTKEIAKNTGLMLLIDPNDVIKKAAASLVSKVFAMDWLYDKTWTDLIGNITMNLNYDNPEIKKAAMMTLGYICEDLNQFKITNLPDEQVEFLLGGICKGLENYNELTNTSVSALSNSINFLASRLQKENVSDYIFNLLISVLINAKKAQNLEIIINLLNLLSELCRLIYTRIDKYSQVIIDEVTECFKLDILIQVTEFFNSLLACEQVHRKGIFDTRWTNIIKEALDVLLMLDPEDDEESGLSKHQSILLLLTSINSLMVNQSLTNLMGFVAFYIEQNDEKSKIAALIAFESLIETAQPEQIDSQVNNGFFGLLNLLTTGSMNLKKHSARVLSKIAKEQTEVFLQDHNFLKAHELFKKILADHSNSEDSVSIKKLICVSYENLAENITKYPKTKVETFKGFSDDIMTSLITSIDHKSDITYMDMVFSASFPFVKNVFESKQLNDYFIKFFDYLNSSIDNFPLSIKKQAVELVFIDLSVIMARLQSEKKKLNAVSKEQLINVYTYVVGMFEKFKEILSEGLLFLANLICIDVETFTPVIDSFLQSYISPALQDSSNAELFKSGIESIGLLAKNVKGSLDNYVKEILPYLLRNLGEVNLRKDLRLPLFFTISDFCLHYPQLAIIELPNIVTTLELALEAVLHFQKSDDNESQEYSDALKEVVLDCYLCIIHGIYYDTDAADGVLENAFKNLISFIKMTAASELNPTIDYLRSCLGCLVDIFCKHNNYSLVDRELVQHIYGLLSKVSHIPGISEILSYTEEKYFAIHN